MANYTFIHDEWVNLLQAYPIQSDDVEHFWQDLVQHYQQVHRYYHHLDHIEAMLKKLKLIENDLTDVDAVKFAIFFHDVIYQTRGKKILSNERQSALYFCEKMAGYLPVNKIEKIVGYILATEQHLMSDQNDRDLAYFLDLDLAILGETSAVYQQYCQAIRQEYHHVPWLFYRFARRKALKNFLQRESIYYSDFFSQKYEKQARENIRSEIKIF